jgi:hypothetical protein
MSKIIWRAILNGRWVGYVVAPSERFALQKAQEKYGLQAIVQPFVMA